ncbi:MAG TPA: heparin lyase I family protein [Hyphomicrobiales bacterium]|nr:heparin lyase I family protein [Hyphomicrobiales bacterium]
MSGGYKPATSTATNPIFNQGVWTFDLRPNKCNPRPYVGNESETPCAGGRRTTQIRAKRDIRVGQTVRYSFEVFIPKDFVYDGDPRFPAYSRLLIAEWKRSKGNKNHLYEMLLDSKRGATYERQICFRPREFGKWNRFELVIKWSRKSDGFMEARCNGRVVLSRQRTQTVIPPDCGAEYKLQCAPEKQIPTAPIMWLLGPNLSGYGRDFASLSHHPKTPFPPFPPNGVKLMMRNLSVEQFRR